MFGFVAIGSAVPDKKIFKWFFYLVWAWRPSWSCDLDYLYTHWFPLPKNASLYNLALTGQVISEKEIFEYFCNIHVCFQSHKYSVHLPISCKFPFQRHFNSFPHSNAKATYVDLAVKYVKVIQGS